LVGIIGRKASDPVEGATSRAMSEADFVWNEQTLDEYLAAPGNKVHGTIMPIGISKAQDRADLIAYIKTMR
jgi:cytochrome c